MSTTVGGAAGAGVLTVRDLMLRIEAEGQTYSALNGVTFEVRKREVYGLIGETGAGKSLTAWSVLGLPPAGGRITGGTITLAGTELVGLADKEYGRLRGNEVSLVVQNPKGSLHPLRAVGRQIAAVRRQHRGGSRKEAMARAVQALADVGVPDPERRARALPHELSGGLAQRVLIAAAMVNEPGLIIADEPTTGLDVTVQAQILELLREKVDEQGISILLITHDLGVVARFCDRVGVMFAGRLVEEGPTAELFKDPRHPYTQKLLQAGSGGTDASDLGLPPDLTALPEGCHYAYRCPFAAGVCRTPVPERFEGERRALCHFPQEEPR